MDCLVISTTKNQKIHRRVTEWVFRLQNVVSALNNEKTRLIGMKPVDAIKQTLGKQGLSQPIKNYEEKLLDVGTKVRYLYEQLSSLLTKILTVIKTEIEKYCSVKASHTGVNNMSVLKNSTNLLSSSGHLGVHRATSIQTVDFSTLSTSIPHDLLKSDMNNIIYNAFKHKSGATQYTQIKVGRNKSYFTSDPLNSDNKYTDICKIINKMIEFFVDNMYVRFSTQLF